MPVSSGYVDRIQPDREQQQPDIVLHRRLSPARGPVGQPASDNIEVDRGVGHAGKLRNAPTVVEVVASLGARAGVALALGSTHRTRRAGCGNPS